MILGFQSSFALPKKIYYLSDINVDDTQIITV